MGAVCGQRSLTTCMIELCAHETACLVDLTHGFTPSGNLAVIPERAYNGVAAGIFRDTQVFRKHQTPAAFYFCDQISVNVFVGRAVRITHVGGHCADNETVGQLQCTDFTGRKNMIQFHKKETSIK